MLWYILGFVLLKIDELEKESLTFYDLFNDETRYNYIYCLFTKNGIIKEVDNSIGVIVPRSIERHTVASLIAISEVLTDNKYFKQKYTITEQVRIMARSFDMKASKASLTKKSPYHSAMVEKLYKILNNF